MSEPAQPPEPQDTEDAIRADRLAKVDAMRDAGVDPYPSTFGARAAAPTSARATTSCPLTRRPVSSSAWPGG